MKRKITILFLIITSFSFSARKKKFYATLSSSTEFENTNKGKRHNVGVKYKPIDFNLISSDNKLKFNFTVQGERKNIKSPNEFYSYILKTIKEKPKFEEREVEDTWGGKKTFQKLYGTEYSDKDGFKMQYYNEKKSEKEKNEYADKYLTTLWDYNEKNPSKSMVSRVNHFAKFNSSQGGHHHHHHHHGGGHHHHHGEGHSHEHSGNRESLDLFTPSKSVKRKENDNLGIKMSLEYFTGLNGIKLTHYLTPFVEEDRRHFRGESIIEGKNTNLFLNKKLSLSFRPRFYLYKTIPLLAELDTDLRYSINKDTTIGIYAYNGLQLIGLDEKVKNKNKIEVFYDYNKEKHRAHKFYEIVDHEHDKLEQIKFKLSFTKDSTHDKNYLKIKGLENEKVKKHDSLTTELEVKLKKTNIFIDGLTLENNFNFEHYKETEKRKHHFYTEEVYTLFENNADKQLIKNDKEGPHDFSTFRDPRFLKETHVYKTKDEDGNEVIEIHEVFEKEYNTGYGGGLLGPGPGLGPGLLPGPGNGNWNGKDDLLPPSTKPKGPAPAPLQAGLPGGGNSTLPGQPPLPPLPGRRKPGNGSKFPPLPPRQPRSPLPGDNGGGLLPPSTPSLPGSGPLLPGDKGYNSYPPTTPQKQKKRYVVVHRFKLNKDIKAVDFDKVVLNEYIKIKNQSRLNYKYKGYNFDLENELNIDRNMTFKKTKIINELKFSVDKDIIKNLNLKLKLNDKLITEIRNIKKRKNKYHINELGIGFDMSYLLDYNKIKIKTGLDFNYSLLSRYATYDYLDLSILPLGSLFLGETLTENEHWHRFGEKSYQGYLDLVDQFAPVKKAYLRQREQEIQKWVHGSRIKLKPYIEIKYFITRGLILSAKANIESTFLRSSIEGIDTKLKFLPSAEKMSHKETDAKLSLNLKYKF